MLSAGKISCCIFIETNPEFWSRPTRQKQILTGPLLVTKVYKNRTTKISLFNYSMLGYISPKTTSLPYIYGKNSCPTHIFKPTHQTWLQASSYPGNISDKFTISFSKIFIRAFCYNNKVTNEVTERLPKLSNKEIHFTFLI